MYKVLGHVSSRLSLRAGAEVGSSGAGYSGFVRFILFVSYRELNLTHSLVIHDAEEGGPKLGDSVELLADAVDLLELTVQRVRVREDVLEGLDVSCAGPEQLRNSPS